MITFKKIELKNFFSVGDDPLKIDLNGPTPTLVSGHNGAGKSVCIVDSICFALFGKPYKKVNKAEIVNKINGNKCLVTLELNVSGSEYKIVRGIKPNVFEIYQDGNILDQDAAVKDQQKLLEENILRLNFESFKQVVILSSSNFIPFMSLTAAQRRAVIEDILDIEIFTDMNKIAKENFVNLKAKIHDIDILIMSKISEIENQQEVIDGYQAEHKEVVEEKEKEIALIDSEILELGESISKKDNVVSDAEAQLSLKLLEARNKLSSLEAEKNSLEKQMLQAKSQIEKAENWIKCNTCEQPITDDMRQNIIQNYKRDDEEDNAKIEDLSIQVSKAGKKLSTLNEIGTAISKDRSLVNELISEKRTKEAIRNTHRKEVERIEKHSAEKSHINTAKINLEKLKEEKHGYDSNFMVLSDDKKYHDLIITLLKDSGIKSMVIDQYMPVINERINFYLKALNFFVEFKLDKNFNETIRVRHRDDQTYQSLSQGEKQRIDLALLFTWRDVAKLKNSINTNLLILDETMDASLDADGVDNLMAIIEEIDDTNIFVISHKSEVLSGVIESQYKFTKDNNFTVLTKL